MTNSQKLVLMVQPSKLQGLIWQTVLKSQGLSVLMESPDADLMDTISQISGAGLNLPDLLLVDVRIQNLNPYAFCRWCREEHPELKIILTNGAQKEISQPERQWAVHQGAADLLPAFQPDNLATCVADSVRRVLEILEDHPLNNAALISVLLAMKRELDARRFATFNNLQEPTTSPIVAERNGYANPMPVKSELKRNEKIIPISSPPPVQTAAFEPEDEEITQVEPLPPEPKREAKKSPPPKRGYRGITF